MNLFEIAHRAERALPEISEHTHSQIFTCPQRDIHIYIYIRVVRLFDGLAEIGAPR